MLAPTSYPVAPSDLARFSLPTHGVDPDTERSSMSYGRGAALSFFAASWRAVLVFRLVPFVDGLLIGRPYGSLLSDAARFDEPTRPRTRRTRFVAVEARYRQHGKENAAMSRKLYFSLSGLIFLLVGVLHFLRLLYHWPVDRRAQNHSVCPVVHRVPGRARVLGMGRLAAPGGEGGWAPSGTVNHAPGNWGRVSIVNFGTLFPEVFRTPLPASPSRSARREGSSRGFRRR